MRPAIVLPAAAFVCFIVLWQWVSGKVNPILFPAPGRVVTALVELITSGTLWPALLTSLQTLALGFSISLVIGIAGGVLTARIPLAQSVLYPYIEAIYATPRVVIIPLVILWFGVGDIGRLFIVVFGTFIPILFNTNIGIRNARADLIEVGRAFGANERQLIWHAILPGAVPYIIAGMRIGIGRTLIGVVLVYALLGTLLMAIAGRVEKHFSSWR